jgi:PAS domain S-box-containing protein
MRDTDKTKDHLIDELVKMRARISELENARPRKPPKQLHEFSAVTEKKVRTTYSIPGNHSVAVISECKQAPAKFLDSPLKWHITIDSVSDAICLLDMEDRVVDCNGAMLKLLGKTAGEILDKTCWSLMHGASEPIDDCPVARMRKSMTRESLELPVADKWFDVVAHPIVDEAGSLIGAIHSLSDITKRKQTEDALRESEARYRNIFDNATEGIYQTTPEGRYLSVNPAFVRMFGYASEEEMMEDVRDIGRQLYVHPEDRERLKKLLAETGRVEAFETQLYHRDGRIIWISINARAVRDATGALLYYEGTNVDITEHKKAEQALQESQQRLSDIIEFLPDATLVIDLQGKVIAWNRAMEEMTGISKDEILGRSKDALTTTFYGQLRPMLADLVLDTDLQLQNLYDHLEKRGNTLCAEVYVPDNPSGKTGHAWATASPLSDRDGNVIGAIESIRDITARKNMETALLEREKELNTKSLELEEMNTALKVLLKHREEDQKEFGANVLSNLKELVHPYLDKLKNSPLNEMQRTYVNILESHLEEIGAPFLRRLPDGLTNLSHMERQIAGLIKDGKRNKEISEILGVSLNTITTHRYHLRTKLGLKNKKINLLSYLQSINSS